MNYSDFIDIHTPRLILRKLKLTDTECFFKFASDREVAKHMLWKTHSSISVSQNSIEDSIKKYEEGKYYRWGIALKENDYLIGIIQLLSFDEDRNSCSFAYMLSKEHWGNGYGTEAVLAVIGFAFENMSVDMIEVDHFSKNIASGAVFKKCGMTYINTVERKYEKDGNYYDADRYILRRSK